MKTLVIVLLAFLVTISSAAQDLDADSPLGQLIVEVFTDQEPEFLRELADTGDPLYIAPLLDLLFFSRGGGDSEVNRLIFTALQEMTGQSFDPEWEPYFNWASENDVALPPDYDEFKGLLLGSLIDPAFFNFFEGVQETAEVNLLEAVWGGVRVDGIPSLVNAPQISPSDAANESQANVDMCRNFDCAYPADDELVFGVSIDGDARAYPLRILNWHEMFNDVIGSLPLYDRPDGEVVCQFRAPTLFSAIARHGADWVQIQGESANCPREGWLTQPESLVWEEVVWSDVMEQLPDVAQTENDPLSRRDGIGGHVPGTPVMLAYCTLCGSGILYSPIIEDGETILEFGSSGLLMRSNKLMYDRTTFTVWNAMTGEPAFGPLAQSGIQLERLPVVVTDWQSWLQDHPDSSILSLETGHLRNYANGAAYADYFNSPDLMFPSWQQDTDQQQNKEMVFALLLDDVPKAYPLDMLIDATVVNDELAGESLVIVAHATPERDFFEPGGAEVRAYAREGMTFSPSDQRDLLIDQDGNEWQITEEALVGPDDRQLIRLPGHLAFWFGWYGFYPETLVYEG